MPALLLGALFGIVVRRHPGIDPASAHPAGAVAHQLQSRRGARMSRLFNPSAETGLLLAFGLLVLVVGGVVLGALGLLVRSNSSLLRIDRSVAPWGRQHTTSFAQWMLDFVTSFGGTGVLVAATVGVFVVEMIRRPSRWLPFFLVAVALGQTLMSSQIKNLLHRVRPTVNPLAHTLGPSFPSGHATGAAACFAALALVLGRGRSRNTQAALAGGAVFIACAVAASRVLLGVHWLTDVIGGLALGWAWFALCSIAFGGRLLRLGLPAEAATRAASLEDGSEASFTPPSRLSGEAVFGATREGAVLRGFPSGYLQGDDMIVVGVILALLGLLLAVPILWIIGLVLVVVGAALWIAGAAGREVGGRRHYY